MLKTFAITVDLETQTAYNKFSVSQGDLNSIALTLNLIQDTKPVNLTDCEVRMVVKKPSGKTIIKDCPIVVPENGTCTVLLGTQASVEIGTYTAELYIYKNDSVAVSGVFTYSSRETIMDDEHVESQNDWQAIHSAIGEAREILDYLEMNGTGIDIEARTDIVDNKAEIEGKLNEELALKRDSSIQLMLEDLHTEVKTAMTGGSVPVVGVNSVGDENIIDGSIAPKKLNFSAVSGTASKNLLDKNSIIHITKFVLHTAGYLLVSESGSYDATDFIEIQPNITYTLSHFYTIAFYDTDKVYISGEGTGDGVASHTFTTPAGAKYTRINVRKTRHDTVQLELGTQVTAYESFGNKIEEKQMTAELKGKLQDIVQYSPSSNLYDKDSIPLTLTHYIVENDGSVGISESGEYDATGFVAIQPTTTYTISHYFSVAFYNASKVFISGIGRSYENDPKTFTTPAGSYYARFTIRKDNNVFQLELGTESTPFEPYGTGKIIESQLSADIVNKLNFNEPLTVKPLKVLMVGNSFSSDAQAYIHELARNVGIKATFGVLYRGGETLGGHHTQMTDGTTGYTYYKRVSDGASTSFTTETEKTLDYGLLNEEWDIVFFQQGSHDSGRYVTFQPFLNELITHTKATVTNPSVKIGLHMTWAYATDSTHWGFSNYNSDQMTMFNAITDAYRDAMKETDIDILVPSGTAIQNARTDTDIVVDTGGSELTGDGFHLTPFGDYIAGLMIFKALMEAQYNKDLFSDLTYTKHSKYHSFLAKKAVENAYLRPFKVTDF